VAQPQETALTITRRHIAGDLLCVGVLISLCLFVGLPRFRSGIDLMDEGSLAYGAVRVMEGQVPNRDFVSLQPPLSFYTAAAMFKFFGTSLVSLRILGLGIYLLIPLLTYGIARNMAGRTLSLAAAIPATILGLPYFHFVPFAIWQGVTATAMAVLFYFWAMRSGSWSWLGLLAGVMTAASLLSRQDQGLYAAISIVAYTLVLKKLVSKETHRRAFGWWVLGVVVGILPWGIYWCAEGALPGMFKQLIVFPVTTYAKTSSRPFPMFSFQEPLVQNAIVGLYYLPPVVQILAAFWLWKQSRRGRWQLREAGVTFMLVWSGLYYCQALTRVDKFHLLIALVPFFILCACGWRAVLDSLEKVVSTTARRVLSAVAAGAVALFLLSTKPVFLANEVSPEEMSLPRAGVRADGGAGLADFIRMVQASAPAGRSILCLPYQPMFYFLCERRNPTRWNYIWPGDQTAEDHATLIQQARRDPPAVVVIAGEADVRGYAPAILDYVHAEFKKTGEGSGYSVYLPK
jgi:hypothetical protein